jgi:hypothetical protein
MDIGMQVSFSETFNIVAADLISQGVPVISTNEIPWMSGMFTASPTDTDEIARMLRRAYRQSLINVHLNKTKLLSYVKKSKDVWLKFFK